MKSGFIKTEKPNSSSVSRHPILSTHSGTSVILGRHQNDNSQSESMRKTLETFIQENVIPQRSFPHQQDSATQGRYKYWKSNHNVTLYLIPQRWLSSQKCLTLLANIHLLMFSFILGSSLINWLLIMPQTQRLKSRRPFLTQIQCDWLCNYRWVWYHRAVS